MASVQIERTGVIRDEKTGETFIPASKRPDGTWRKPRRVRDGYIPQEEMPVYESKGMQWLNSMPTLPPGLNPTEPATTTKAVKVSKKQKKKSQTDSLKQPREADDLVEFVARKLDDLTCKDSRSANQEPLEQEFKVVTSRKSKAKSKATAENVTTTTTNNNNNNNSNTNINTTPTATAATSNNNSNNCKMNLTQKTTKSKVKATSSSNTTTPATTTANNNKKNTNNNNNNSGGGGVEAEEGGQTDPGKRLRNLKKKLKQIEELEAKIKGGQLNPSQEQRDKVTRKKAVKAEIKKLEAIVC